MYLSGAVYNDELKISRHGLCRSAIRFSCLCIHVPFFIYICCKVNKLSR